MKAADQGYVVTYVAVVVRVVVALAA